MSFTWGPLLPGGAQLQAAVPIEGTLSTSIGSITLSSAGTLPIVGTLSTSIGTITLSAAGTLPIVGTLSSSIGTITIVATGAAGAIAGTLAQSIGTITLSAFGLELPGSTLTALQAGSIAYKWVAAIEGYDYLLSDATSAQAVDAWNGTDWTSALGESLYVELQNEQKISPWEPFTGGGKLTLRVIPTDNDQFGIDTHTMKAGRETVLTSTVSVSDATIPVLSTTGFASSGTVHIGNEAITYSGKTSNTFTGCTRGKWSPFPAAGSETDRFAYPHFVATDPNAVRIRPLVTTKRRTWIGRWVGLWMHRYDHENGVLNSKANARLVYAGRIVEIADDPSTMTTVVHCEHVLDYIKRGVIGRDMWSATVKEGLYVEAGWNFLMSDTNDGGVTYRTADNLVVGDGAETANLINPGVYTNAKLLTKINQWLKSERAANRIFGKYSISVTTDNGDLRSALTYFIQGSSTDKVDFALSLPKNVNRFLGEFEKNKVISTVIGGKFNVVITNGLFHRTNGVTYTIKTIRPPMRNLVSFSTFHFTNGTSQRIEVENERGVFTDQTDDMPMKYNPSGAVQLGLVLINGEYLAFVNRTEDGQLQDIMTSHIKFQGASPLGYRYLDESNFNRLLNDESGQITIKQVLVVEGKFANFVKRIFFSTGGAGYNHTAWDNFPIQMALTIPGSLLGDNFIRGVDALPGAKSRSTIILSEPTLVTELLNGALVFRWGFLRWKNQGVRICTWKTPTTGPVLSESNKAAPVNMGDNHRTAAVLTSEWQKQVIKVHYDKDIHAHQADGGYRSSITVVDRVAIDDAGGDIRIGTIKLRDSYGRAGVNSQKGQFLAGASHFTRALRKMTRSIDSRFFEGYSVGDAVLVTDTFCRDPSTGQRGFTLRPAIIISHKWSPGGPLIGAAPADMHGEVDLLFYDVVRARKLAPAAKFNEGATNSGYVVGTKTITAHASFHSEATETADAAQFMAGDAVKIVEIDPEDPAAADTHTDIVASQSGNDIVLTTGFAGFDNTKQYRITYGDYADVTEDQKESGTFQADSADGMVNDEVDPYHYAIATEDETDVTENDASDPVELPADDHYGDGVAMDAGTAQTVARLINNLIDDKTAISAPQLSKLAMPLSFTADAFQLVEIRPLFLGYSEIDNAVSRSLTVGPYMKSSDGNAATVRVTVAPSPPNIMKAPADTEETADLTFGVTNSVEFTTDSTDYLVPGTNDISLNQVRRTQEVVWILIEVSSNAMTRGLAVCREAVRDG